MDCRPLLLAFLLALPAYPQQQTQTQSQPGSTANVAKVDPRLHADVVKLLELSGTRERLKGNLPKMIEDGKKQMMQVCKTCSQEFANEWGKRMEARLDLGDFVDVTIRAHEKYLTDEEVNELITLQKNAKSDPPPVPSAALKQKLIAVFPSLMADISAGCVQIATKLGAEIGGEIEKEHPEYFKASPEAEKKQ